jgi:hypothetical protein
MRLIIISTGYETKYLTVVLAITYRFDDTSQVMIQIELMEPITGNLKHLSGHSDTNFTKFK